MANRSTSVTRIGRKLRFTLSRLGNWESWKRVPFKLMVRYVAPERPRRFPIRIQIEATSKCNLSCPCCSHSREKDKGQHLTEEQFRQILDRLPWSPKRVILCGVGEPLMNPQFFSFVDLLAERGIKCEFYTNGTLLTARMQQAILLRRNIDAISISCDGARKETFDALRLGADFDRWKQSVREFLIAVKHQRERVLSVGANIVVAKQNLAEIGDIVRLAANLGFDSVGIIDPVPVDDTAAAYCPSLLELSAVHREELFALARRLGLKILYFLRRGTSAPKLLLRCMQPWEYVFIRANGDVAPCCAVFGSEKAAVMGNILQQEFDDIWHGERFRAFRRSYVLGTNPLCRICPYA